MSLWSRHRRVDTLMLLAVAVLCTTLVTRRALSEPQTRQVRDTLPIKDARDTRGRIVPVLRGQTPTIVMINSRTCPWCKKSLTDIGRLADGRPLPHLTVLTLEGAPFGKPMLEQEHIVGATLLGPATTASDLQKALGHTGTPVFIAVDAKGQVLQVMPGYPIYEEMKRWVAVMAGDAASP